MLQDLQIQTEASTNRLQDVRRRDPSNPALFYDIWKFMRGWSLWWWWWWLWWYWWLVSLETTNFWLLLRDKKMFFFTCILMQYPACLPTQGRRGRRRERAPGRLPLLALPLPDHVPPQNSFAITLNTSEDQEMIVYCVCFVLTELGKLLPIKFSCLQKPNLAIRS